MPLPRWEARSVDSWVVHLAASWEAQRVVMRVVRSVVTMDAHLVASLAVQMVDKTVDTTAAR